MIKKIDLVITLAFVALFGWGGVHGLIYDTFNDDATYNNTQLDRILPILSLIGNTLIIFSLFVKTKNTYLITRLIAICLITPQIINNALMKPLNNESLFDKVLDSTFTVENFILLFFVGFSFFVYVTRHSYFSKEE